jgi:hypothetical protein
MALELLGKIPRRVIYTLVLIVMILPLFFPLNLPMAITPESRTVFDDVQALEGTGKYILFLHMMGPVFWGEFQHMYHAILQHWMLLDDVKLVVAPCGQPAGMMLFSQALAQVSNPLNKEYGVDWVQLPFIPGRADPAFANMMTWPYTTDEFGTPLEDLPILQEIESFDALMDRTELVFWAEMARDQPSVPRVIYPRYPDTTYFTMCGAEGFAFVAPYLGMGNVYKSGLWGARPAAEYQTLFGGPYSGALAQMDSLSTYSLLTVIVILLGNIALLGEKLKQTGAT